MNRLGRVGMLLTVDECADSLHRAGWSMGELLAASGWLVTGLNGENLIQVRADTQSEAWERACVQASTEGMLASAGD
jgi:hypothetical protein